MAVILFRPQDFEMQARDLREQANEAIRWARALRVAARIVADRTSREPVTIDFDRHIVSAGNYNYAPPAVRRHPGPDTRGCCVRCFADMRDINATPDCPPGWWG